MDTSSHNDKMHNIALFTVFLVFTVSIFSSTVSSSIITVCSSGCDNTTIQSGINFASVGDEIRIVDNRTYNESVVVNKTRITLTSNSSVRPLVINPFGHVIEIASNDTIVSHLSVLYNGSSQVMNAVRFSSVSNATLSNNTLNSSTGNKNYVIYSDSSNSSTISYNNIFAFSGSNKRRGLTIYNGLNNSVYGNVIITSASHNNAGLTLNLSSNTNISFNDISTEATAGSEGDSPAIFIVGGGNNIANDNYLVTQGNGGSNIGIHIVSSNDNTFRNNDIHTNASGNDNHGISLSNESFDNTFFSNNITTNNSATNYGIYFNGSSENNTFYDSIINAISAPDIFVNGEGTNYLVDGSFNRADIGFNLSRIGRIFFQHRLDVTIIDGSSNSIDGAYVWANDSESVENVTNPASEFNVTTNSSGQIETQILSQFLANSTYNSTLGYLNFSDYSLNATKSGFIESIQFSLNESKNLVITISSINPPTTTTTIGGSSGGGSGGGGGGSFSVTTSTTLEEIRKVILPIEEVVENIKTNLPNVSVPSHVPSKIIKITSDVNLSADEEGIVEIGNADMAIKKATIRFKQDVKTTFDIKQLVFKPEEVKEVEEPVYRYFDINTPEEVEEATIEFEVDEEWIFENNGTYHDVTMKRFHGGKWENLETSRIGKLGKLVKFRAKTSGFSVFVISISVPVTGSIIDDEGPIISTSVKNENNSESLMPLTKIIFITIILVLISVFYLKRTSIKKEIQFASAKNNTIKKKSNEKYTVKVEDILKNPKRYDGCQVTINECSFSMVERKNDKYSYTIKDSTGNIIGFSKKKIENKNSVTGIVLLTVTRAPFIEF